MVKDKATRETELDNKAINNRLKRDVAEIEKLGKIETILEVIYPIVLDNPKVPLSNVVTSLGGPKNFTSVLSNLGILKREGNKSQSVYTWLDGAPNFDMAERVLEGQRKRMQETNRKTRGAARERKILEKKTAGLQRVNIKEVEEKINLPAQEKLDNTFAFLSWLYHRLHRKTNGIHCKELKVMDKVKELGVSIALKSTLLKMGVIKEAAKRYSWNDETGQPTLALALEAIKAEKAYAKRLAAKPEEVAAEQARNQPKEPHLIDLRGIPELKPEDVVAVVPAAPGERPETPRELKIDVAELLAKAGRFETAYAILKELL